MNKTRFQPWQELAILALIGMDLSWVALWLRVVSRTGSLVSYWRVLAVLGGMLVAVYGFAHLLNQLRLRLYLRRGALAAMLLGAILLGEKLLLFLGEPAGLGEILRRTLLVFGQPDGSIPSEFIVALTLIGVWWRGISLAGREVESAQVRLSFYIGVFMLFAYGLIASAGGETGSAPLILFLFFWLLAMSAARIYHLARSGRGRPISFDRKWMAGTFLAVTGVVGASAIVSGLMDWKGADWVSFLLVWIVRAALVVGVLLISPVILLLSALMPSLQKWLDSLPQGLGGFGEVLNQLGNMLEQLQEAVPEEPFSLPPAVRPAVLWGILGLAALLAVWALRKRSMRFSPAGGDESETLLSQGELLQKLLSALRGGLGAVAGQLGDSLSPDIAGRRFAAARVRRIYARLMDLSAELGKPRPLALTPLEYLPILDRLFPNHYAELRLITRTYLKVRYGELPESRQEIEAVEAAWKRVKEQGRVLQEYERMRKAPGRA